MKELDPEIMELGQRLSETLDTWYLEKKSELSGKGTHRLGFLKEHMKGEMCILADELGLYVKNVRSR